MRLQTKWIVVLGLLMFVVVLGSFAPADAQQARPLDFTLAAQVPLPLNESLSDNGLLLTPTPTPTSTAVPGPPVLLAPANGAVLSQPVGLNGWLFRWQARMGPCHSSFKANGPNGYAITAQVYYTNSVPGGYSYYYTRTMPFLAPALGQWTWQATVICPLATVQSETRTFYLKEAKSAPTPTPSSTAISTPTSTANPPTPTITPSPTSQPGPPTLIAPANGIVLKQPIDGNEWLFHWNARTGPCHSSLSATGPNGYSIYAVVNFQSSSPGPYSYHYTRTVPFPAEAFGLWTWHATVSCPLGSAQSETRTFYLEGEPTPTPTPTSAATPTQTPTSMPGPPTLLAPASGAVLTQPVGLNEWLFHWNARTGPCHSSLSATGPYGYSINAVVNFQSSSPGPYSYHYTRTAPFPAEAFGLWTWHATVSCPLGSAQSETRTFYLEGEPTPTPTPTCTVDW